MNEKDELRVVFPYWIEHKNEHVREIRDWFTQAGEIDQDILDAVEVLSRGNMQLLSVLKKHWTFGHPMGMAKEIPGKIT